MLVFNMSEINLLWTFDARFWKMATVSINSALGHLGAGAKCTVYCMVAPRTPGRRYISKIIRRYPNARLIWRVVRNRENPFRTHDFSRWSPVIFYRLIAGRIFPGVKKMLYLDSDTLVQDDLTQLFNTDVSQYVIGAVRDMAPTEDAVCENAIYVREFIARYLTHGIYVNSGVLLINMEKMTNLIDKMLVLDIPLKYPDQDILNAATDGQIYLLPLRYNFAPGVKIPAKFVGADVDTTPENAAVLHFYSGKPYIYSFVPRNIYSIFYRAASAVGFHPDDLAAHDERIRRRRYCAKTVVPWLRITRDGKLKFFGITIK